MKLSYFKYDQVTELMKCSDERKIRLYETYSQLKDLSPFKEELLGKLLKSLNKIVFVIRQQQEKTRPNATQIEIYDSIEVSIKKNAKLIDKSLSVLTKVLFFIESGHTR